MVASFDSQSSVPRNLLGLGRAQASVLIGLDAQPIQVEVCSSRGPACFQMVGLPEAAVREARVRIQSALAALGVLLDEYAVTVNLAPADLKKPGASLDLPLAVATLMAIGRLSAHSAERTLLLGELGLDGTLRPVRGVLPLIEAAERRGITQAFVPRANAMEAALVPGICVWAASSLSEVLGALTGRIPLEPVVARGYAPENAEQLYGDFSEVRGQVGAKRGLEIAAAGQHNVLMLGPPGSGKTLLARLLPTITAPLTFEEALAVTKIHSVAGLLDPDQGIVRVRPFRAPHHSVSEAGLIGGGEVPRPGEISLAHHGVLFLDELTEFRRSTLEALRVPLEDGVVCVARARATAWFPCRPLVVMAANPCACGYLGHPTRSCRCTPKQLTQYRSRLSGPIVDRLDVHLHVPPVDPRILSEKATAESSDAIRDRVMRARARQAARASMLNLTSESNARLSLADLEVVAPLDSESRALMERAVLQLGLSARAYVKVLRVARTIADLEGEERVRAPHIAESLQGRLLDYRTP